MADRLFRVTFYINLQPTTCRADTRSRREKRCVGKQLLVVESVRVDRQPAPPLVVEFLHP